MAKKNYKELPMERREELINILKTRFAKHPGRHQGLAWPDVQARLEAKPAKLWTLDDMETTGGEPDVVGLDAQTGEYLFFDCTAESPAGRRSLCYDREGLKSRKEHRPATSALDLAADMGIELLTEAQYRELQQLGRFDAKTSSWLQTPANIRTLGGALFADFRFGTVFVYHNGAQAYYSGRGFRGVLKV